MKTELQSDLELLVKYRNKTVEWEKGYKICAPLSDDESNTAYNIFRKYSLDPTKISFSQAIKKLSGGVK